MAFLQAVASKSLPVVRIFVEEIGAVPDQSALRRAAVTGVLDVVEYLHNTSNLWTDEDRLYIMQEAAAEGHVHILDWARARGFSLIDTRTDWQRADLTVCACASSATAALLWLTERLPDTQYGAAHLRHAAFSGSWAVFQFLLAQGCEVTPEVYEQAARQQDIRFLKQLFEIGACELSDEAKTKLYSWATSGGNLQTIKYLHEVVQCPWDPWTIITINTRAFDISGLPQYLYDQGVATRSTTRHWHDSFFKLQSRYCLPNYRRKSR